MTGRLITDTSDFCSIDKNDEIVLGEKIYVVTGNPRELRFGIEDPKLWVKWAFEKNSNEKKIIKLVYFEEFNTSLGGVTIKCFRNPRKEAEILELVNDHPYFMQGRSFYDEKFNNIRLIDIVRGQNFYFYIESLRINHKKYFYTMLPGILKNLIKAFEALRFLHINGQKHGDVRNDHIIIEKKTGNYVWIDFDYDYAATENPLGLDIFGMGNILLYAIGKGFHTLHMIKYQPSGYPKNLFDDLAVTDMSMLDKSRVMNLQKIFPYIPKIMNDILIHFSRGAEIYYETAEEIVEELNRCLYVIY